MTLLRAFGRRLRRLAEPPPGHAAEHVPTLRVLHWTLLTADLVLLLLLATAPLLNPNPVPVSLFYGAFLLVVTASLVLLRRGHHRALAVFATMGLWLVTTCAALLYGGLRSHALLVYPLVVLLAGFFWSVRAAVAVTSLTSLLGLALAGAEIAGALPAPPDTVTPYRIWAALTGTLAITTMLLAQALGSIRRAIADAHRSEGKFRDVLQATPDGIAVVGHDGRIVEANRALENILGRAREELLGRSIDELVVRGAGGETSSFALDATARRRDGTVFPVEIRQGPIDTEEGPTLVLAIRDVEDERRAEEERRRLEERLRLAERMESLGQFAGGVAHDFNNLLTVILGNCSLALARADRLEPGLRRRVEEIETAARRGAHLTAQLLAFGRRQVLEPRIVDLNDVVRATQELLARLVGEDIRIRLVCRPVARVRVDPHQVEQILLNLAANARDAMPEGGVLTIETSAGGEAGPDGATRAVRLTVRDTGRGMDEATRARIFEPFFTTKERGKGTGLGLATVHGIVAQSGGSIDVDTAPGRGTAVHIDLPVAVGAESPEESEPAPRDPHRPAGTILFVEDDDAVREVGRSILEGAGYRVLTAPSPAEALELAAKAAIDLLVTDVVMPGGSGPRLAETLLADRPGLRVLFVSGYAEERIDAERLGGELHFLPKPFTRQGLVDKVGAVLATRPVRA